MRKVLFFDVDGTLVDGKTHTVADSTIEALKKAQEKGHLLFVNTGRAKSFIPDSLKEIPFDGYVYSCGAHIEFHGETLMEKYVGPADVNYIRELMLDCNIQGTFEGPEYCYFYEGKPLYDNLRDFMTMYDRDYHNDRKSIYDRNMQVNKLTTFYTECSDPDTFRMALEGKYQLIENGNGFIEILPLPYTKATAIEYLMDYLHVKKEECFVFGDSPNDIEMMGTTGTSICMGNGYDSVKAISDYVTTNINDGGIYHAMEHYHLI